MYWLIVEVFDASNLFLYIYIDFQRNKIFEEELYQTFNECVSCDTARASNYPCFIVYSMFQRDGSFHEVMWSTFYLLIVASYRFKYMSTFWHLFCNFVDASNTLLPLCIEGCLGPCCWPFRIESALWELWLYCTYVWLSRDELQAAILQAIGTLRGTSSP